MHSPIMSPLVWDLGHIAAYEDLWLGQRHAGLELLRPDLAELYDAFETPRAVRGEIEALGPADGARVPGGRPRAHRRGARRARGSATGRSTRWCSATSFSTPRRCARRWRSPVCCPPASGQSAIGRCRPGRAGPSEWIALPAGAFDDGRRGEGFAYDNERPRHTVERGRLRGSRDCRSATRSWMRFSEGGGYERREWWSDEGWAWKQEYDITHHPADRGGRCARRPPATSPGSRPTPSPERTTRACPPRPSGSGRRPGSRRQPAAIGRVWEWTSSTFHGYPGFSAYPYREYSEVFFGEDYRVLRGGSWATHPRVADPTFRNWDLPLRRQIFAGVRLARDGARA